MTRDAVLQVALQLSTRERADVAAELLASLASPSDNEVEKDWAAEIEHRARRALAGESASRPWGEVRKRVEGRLRRTLSTWSVY